MSFETTKSAPPPYSQYPQGYQTGDQVPPGYGPYAGAGQAPPSYGFQTPLGQPAYQPPQQAYPPQAGATVITMQPTAHHTIVIGGCPNCRTGILEEEYSCLGIFCAIFFFPLGILCCLLTRQRRCTNCRAIY